MIDLCSFDEEILHDFGSLKPDATSSINWSDRNLEDIPQSDRIAKKKRENEAESIIVEQNAMVEEPMKKSKTELKRNHEVESSRGLLCCVLDNIGLEPQVERIGKYKSAGDQLARRTISLSSYIEMVDDIIRSQAEKLQQANELIG
ncbi:hypothetical protein QN277_011679 [Acacia crassicarpa]|uniref:Uncharacterized protein n=1 Tax=Acacia crassicarpa TaxID=499986 RepID=A0AAE1TCL5_9FABA|nr:hypothetical protein QN277_011679 [Acacia crassicarpa]